MKKIVVVSCSQFGYHTDMLMHCRALKEEYKIKYICSDQGNKKVIEDDVLVEYINESRLNFIKESKKIISDFKPDIVIVDYFIGSSLLKILSSSGTFILDYRTGSVDPSPLKRKIKNALMIIEAKTYKYKTIISEGLRERLHINSKNSAIISLGATRSVSDEFIKSPYINDEMNLIYVGVFSGRNIIDTVKGYHMFLKENDFSIKTRYSIIGYGDGEEEIINYIKENKLEKFIKFHGRLHNEDLIKFFEESNVGVSYVPINYQYDVQPPTKTFEYMMNGLVCIATGTQENKKVVNEKNGVIISDTPKEFCNALKIIKANLENYSKIEIANSVSGNKWDNISKEFRNYIKKVCDSNE